MPPHILLAGGAEFGGRMAETDRRAIELAGGTAARIRIIPTAAVPDNNHRRAGADGVRWFRSLGATDTAALPLTDRASANHADMVADLRAAQLIYLLGGFPHYLAQMLAGSQGWQAALAAHAAGALIGGSSAGAMALCEHYYDPQAQRVEHGLGLLPNACVLPHHNTFGQAWAARLRTLLPTATLIGIDEHTALINDGPGHTWRVYGPSTVTVYQPGAVRVYRAGDLIQMTR